MWGAEIEFENEKSVEEVLKKCTVFLKVTENQIMKELKI